VPANCPIKKLGLTDCILCHNNRDGYCWGLCPPKECKRPLDDILTVSERLYLLEGSLENIKCLGNVEELEKRIRYMESLVDTLEKKTLKQQIIIDQLNTLQDTVNLTLQRFSKRLIILEEKEGKGKKRYNEYK
jgi:hypothetical protein